MKHTIFKLIFISLIFILSSCTNVPNTLDIEDCNYYENKIVTYLGDSITENCRNDKGYIQYLEEHFKFKESYNLGISGTTISGDYKDGAFFKDERINQIPENSNYIFIYGGINDCWQGMEIGEVSANNINSNTLVGAYNILIEKIEDKFPNSKLIIIVPHFVNLDNFISYANAIIEVAKINNISYIDLFNNSSINKDNYKKYTTDGVHLKQSGYYLIAKCIGENLIANLY